VARAMQVLMLQVTAMHKTKHEAHVAQTRRFGGLAAFFLIAAGY
jgi:hypothetical protein